MIDIPELTRDALVELINISIGKSANAMNEMIRQEITLSVPEVELMAFEDAEANLKLDANSNELTTVGQDFNGPVAGKSFLVLPKHNSLQLVQLILGDDVPAQDIPEYEEETLVEVGNVILNAFLGSLSNELYITITTDIPKFSKSNFSGKFGDGDLKKHTVIMSIHVDFKIKNEQINGYLMLVINLMILKSLIYLIDKYIERIT